ncbi:MAG: hypothetical protein K8T89_27170 [Planctomycetes bacterium]|nr:hypothetical protein [Planctomycetota bacterium]
MIFFQSKLFWITLAVVGVGVGGYVTRPQWMPWLDNAESAISSSAPRGQGAPTGRVILTDQAQANLGLTTKAAHPGPYWKKISVAGMIVDRPGQSDRSVVAPIASVVTSINHFPGDTVRPGNLLFTLKLQSESLHQTQSDLFKAAQEIGLATRNKKRLMASAVPEIRLFEIENQITRLEITVKAYRLELLTRGFSETHISMVADGIFVNELQISVPPRTAGSGPSTLEIQELKVDLGQQVPAGHTLCLLANHRNLAIEGRAFRDDTPYLERAAKQNWPIEVDFGEEHVGDREAALLIVAVLGQVGAGQGSALWAAMTDLHLGDAEGWFPPVQKFTIEHLSNTINPANRTFAFFLPLQNQSRVIERAGKTQLLWRFRPGQRVRLLVPIEKWENVFVLPSDAVARDGAEAFVFTQNANTFERTPVRVLFQDRRDAVVANDGSLPAGSFVAQSAASQLNRLSKAATNAVPAGYHIHADGSLHKNEDEGK